MNHKAFTILELIVVIIIIGILATLGLTTYTNQIEYARIAEAKANLGAMRKLAYQYYLANGSLTNIQNSDVGATNTCDTTAFFKYTLEWIYADRLNLVGYRCNTKGYSPYASRGYALYIPYYPGTGQGDMHCRWNDDYTTCFGMPP